MPNFDFFKVYPSLFKFLEDVNHELIIICPYIKIKALKRVLAKINPSVKVIVVVRWQLSDILFGSSDLEIYPYLKKLGHELFVNNSIHLKVLIKDKNFLFLGSANITDSGLGFSKKSNIEGICTDSLDFNNMNKLNNIFKSSVKVDDTFYKKISTAAEELKDLKNILDSTSQKMKKFDSEINKKKAENVLVYDFPFYDSPEEFLNDFKNQKFDSLKMKHDLTLFNLKITEDYVAVREKLKSSFLSSSAYSWQNSIITDSILFGKYSSVLHDALIDEPKPYRKTVKELVNNMFNWTEVFSDEFKIKKHRHTHSLVRI
ncbi:phospholipase D-like domain-containing protein [Candidatus Undinarchaeota archaeon]